MVSPPFIKYAIICMVCMVRRKKQSTLERVGVLSEDGEPGVDMNEIQGQGEGQASKLKPVTAPDPAPMNEKTIGETMR